MEEFICPRCGCSDPRYIGIRNGKKYCRRCISFNGRLADEDFAVHECDLHLEYPLSEEQQKLSLALLENFKMHKNAIVHAVTGSGKTELIYKTIEYCLKNKLHVGFSIPRVDIVREMKDRFQQAFPSSRICLVYGEHSQVLNGDIIILTAHQLYRYEAYFDLLIMDEIDAFPFKNNEILNCFFRKSLRGNYILMSATATKQDIENVEKDNGTVFELMKRYHGHKMPVPKYIKESVFPRFQVLRQLKMFLEQKKPVLIFVPTIEIGKVLARFLCMFYKNGTFVSSKTKERKEIIERFKLGLYQYLVTTSILERGVTIKDLQVIIFNGDSEIYDSRTIVQISGRVGRKIDATDGKVIIYAKEKNSNIKEAIRTIQDCNQKAGL